MAYYVDVILPIPVNQKFTYIISKDEYDFIKPGSIVPKVLVPFPVTYIPPPTTSILSFFFIDFYFDTICSLFFDKVKE